MADLPGIKAHIAPTGLAAGIEARTSPRSRMRLMGRVQSGDDSQFEIPRNGTVQSAARRVEDRGAGCIVLDRSHRVVNVGAQAQKFLERGGLSVRNGYLETEDATQKKLLVRALDTACDDATAFPTVALSRARYVTPLIVSFTDHTHADRTSECDHPTGPRYLKSADRGQIHQRNRGRILAMLQDPSWLDEAALTKLTWLGLTYRERQLSFHLAQGLRAARFAETHDLSTETVKSHLKAIFRKLGVHNQVELVVCLLAMLR